MAEVIAAHPRLLRPIPTNSAHLTYAFLAHVPPERLETVLETADGVARRSGPVGITLGVPVVLTGGSEARLICAAVETGASQLWQLARAVSGALAATLAPLECRATKSLHVTLARFRKGTRISDARAIRDHLVETGLRTSETIDRLDDPQSRQHQATKTQRIL